MPTPRDIANAFDLHLAAVWRGDEDIARRFNAWLMSFWRPEAPPEPHIQPDAASFLSGSSDGLRLYAKDDVVLGYVHGRPFGCYHIPVDTAIPSDVTPTLHAVITKPSTKN